VLFYSGSSCSFDPSIDCSSFLADATVPSIYHKAFAAVDPANVGETSVNLLSRVLGTSLLPAATIDKVSCLSCGWYCVSYMFSLGWFGYVC
jgi:hypothetical protein